jgi:AcrR family transcriptional regulator
MTSSPSFQRARRPEHKQQRREAILDAARTLALESGVQSVSLGDVATAAGMAKSNVLRYFETREEIYLELTTDAFGEWSAALPARLGARRSTPARVAAVLADSLSERPLLCDLLSQVSATLERNISPARGRDFKLSMHEHAGAVSAAVTTALPGLTDAQAYDVLAASFALVAGLWPAAHPCAELAAVLELPELVHTRIDFHASLRRLLRALLTGLLAGSPH